METERVARAGPETFDLDELDAECVETFESTKEKLEAVERRLAEQLQIRGPIRRALITLDRAKKLVEDELVVQWHELLASYNDWTRSDAWDAPPLVREDSAPPKKGARDERAAQAALAALWGIRLDSTAPSLAASPESWRTSTQTRSGTLSASSPA